ncbi:MAG: gamma-glutamyl-gamma-aminobutyrate hydrolase family protein [Dehalococcoidia bacterium]
MNESRPRIGVTRWETFPGGRIENYWEAVEAAGGEHIDLRDPASGSRELDGLVLTGGLDVDPARYGETPHPTVKRFDPERDAFELRLLSEALERDLPIFAICRGHQLLNVAFGGTLLQHIEDNSHRAQYEVEGFPSRWHTVRVKRATKLFELLGREEITVNSRHHQAVTPDRLATGLRATAMSSDGFVEGIESAQHRWVLGVQWHPERPEAEHNFFAPENARLFEALVAEARKVGTRT